jgi:hypothetical protein
VDTDAQAHIESLWENVRQQSARIRKLEDMIDTRSTPLWKRIVFRLDGWPPWHVVADGPAWRPWRRWWTS